MCVPHWLAASRHCYLCRRLLVPEWYSRCMLQTTKCAKLTRRLMAGERHQSSKANPDHAMDSSTAKKQASTANKLMYPEQHQKLQEMGFDSKSIQDALVSTSGDLQAATAVLLGETTVPTPPPQPAKTVAPMKVVGKQSSAPAKPAKIDYKEVHNKFMATYKVNKCKEKANHDKRLCFNYHAKGDRRRNPFEIAYTCTECPNSTETTVCENGDACMKAHNMLERMFHPDLFKISMCQRGPNGSHCERGNLCAFAHSEEDHRVPSSLTAVKPVPAQPSTTITIGPSPAATSASTLSNQTADTITASKSLTDSRMLDSIQDKLVKLIQNQGGEGIISSELPKRYFDAYGERLDLADEAGEKFRIKDLLLAHSNISMTMHKGVQPKYVYEDKPGAKPASAASVVSKGVSYSAVATQNVKQTANKPLNYAAAIAPGLAANKQSAPAAAPAPAPVANVSETASDTSKESAASSLGATAGTNSATSTPAPAASEASSAQWVAAGLLDGPAPASPATANASFLPIGTRRRGPDSGHSDRADTATPPVHSAVGPHSPGLTLADVATTHTTANSSNVSSPGKAVGVGANGAVAEYHERLVQAHSTCEKLAHQVQLLQGELSKRHAESEIQTLQLQGMMTQLSESADNQNKANTAKDAAMSEVFRVRHELEELRNNQQSATGAAGDAQRQQRDLQSKENTIAQLRQERATDLKQFCSNLGQIESALVEMQRKEAAFINEIPLHDTINESSRARDELTKYVTMLKQQMTNRILNETAAANANSGAGMSSKAAAAAPSVSVAAAVTGGAGVGGLSSLLGGVGAQSDVLGSPLRGSFVPQAGSFLPGAGFLSKPADGLLLGQSSAGLLGDDLGLVMPGAADPYSLLLGSPASVPLQSNGVAGSRVLGGLGGAASVLNAALPTPTVGAMQCALPGCSLEGTFVCSACNRSGYCGAPHQREHWAVHMKECGLH